MPVLSPRSAGLAALLAILLLRVVIGVHFVREGEKKFHSDLWSAGSFFGAAKGPFAPFFQSLVADNDGFERLCFDADGKPGNRIDPAPTLRAWDDFKELVATHYRFGDPAIEDLIRGERETNRKRLEELESLRESGDESAWTESLTNELIEARETERRLREEIEALRRQNEAADAVLAGCSDSLLYVLDGSTDEINNYFDGWETRRRGFARDGEAKEAIIRHVESLQGQQATISVDMIKARGPWLAEIDATWNSLEKELNAIALPRQRNADGPADGIEVRLDRPNAKTPLLRLIDSTVPYFDIAVGILLIVGLGTRIVGLIGAGFLSMIVATQLPGVPGAQDSISQIIEMGGLLVLAAVGGGQFGGLDYFIGRFARRGSQAREESGT
ncbi:MAG TPA: DoxX family protein [Pirellulaceae bacterium]|nr:DoxX family protein [Pirellulaceae bacterium]